jgi:putative tryptophan/tyrosine transport system substrate-binding protein
LQGGDGPGPGGNLTGFNFLEAEMGGKWAELLMEIGTGIKRVAIMFNPDTASGRGSYYLPSFEAAAKTFKVAMLTAPVRGDAEIEAVITSLAREPGSGLAVTMDAFVGVHRASLAARNKVPAVGATSSFARDGGLLSYGPDTADNFSVIPFWYSLL